MGKGMYRFGHRTGFQGEDEAVCWNASRRAGVFGGARVGKPRCARILAITEGSSIAARMIKGPPHCGQVVMSMAKTRLSNCAQLMRARVETEESLLFPSARFDTVAASEKY